MLVSGKYRDEVELAVQHATALRLPGAAYRLEHGLRTSRGACVPWARATPAQQQRASRGRAANCSAVVVAAPEQHAVAFRAVLSSLEFTGLRKRYSESTHLVWV